MLYYLFEFLEKQYQLPGASLFRFLTFRAAMAVMLSLLIAMVYGKRIIVFLQKKQIGESIRDLGLEGQQQKAGTPTMGGLIIIMSTLLPVILFADIKNIYVILLIVTTIWMGIIGFVVIMYVILDGFDLGIGLPAPKFSGYLVDKFEAAGIDLVNAMYNLFGGEEKDITAMREKADEVRANTLQFTESMSGSFTDGQFGNGLMQLSGFLSIQ